MKILVCSDTHGHYAEISRILNREHFDLAVHLGDHADDALFLSKETDTPLLWVSGNCDPFSGAPKTLTTVWEGHTVYLCHGHTHSVKASLLQLYYAALEQGATLSLFGHTHMPCDEVCDTVRLINPGAVKSRSYAVLTVTQDTVDCEFRTL